MTTAPTWAQVVRKKKSPAFLPTECAVNLEQFAAPQRLPPSSSRYSTFVPLPSDYKEGWAMSIVSALPTSAVGIVPRADISLLEVCFANKEAQQDFLSTPLVTKHFTAHPVPPAGTPSLYVPIKMMNVPVLASIVVEQQLRSFWSSYGEVVAIAPHMYKNTPLQSNRWDLVLKLTAGTVLSATPFFDVLGFKVMASWPGSDKACPRCKLVGHDSRTCPKRPKASKKRSTTTKQPTTNAGISATLGTASTSSSAAPRGSTAEVATPISDPNIGESTDMDIVDEDMADVSTSASTSTPTPTPTISSAGPQRMAPKDILRLSPSQLSSISPSVAPKSISMDLYLQLSPEQMDVIPDFIQVKETSSKKPVAPPLRRTRSQNKDKK